MLKPTKKRINKDQKVSYLASKGCRCLSEFDDIKPIKLRAIEAARERVEEEDENTTERKESSQ